MSDYEVILPIWELEEIIVKARSSYSGVSALIKKGNRLRCEHRAVDIIKFAEKISDKKVNTTLEAIDIISSNGYEIEIF